MKSATAQTDCLHAACEPFAVQRTHTLAIKLKWPTVLLRIRQLVSSYCVVLMSSWRCVSTWKWVEECLFVLGNVYVFFCSDFMLLNESWKLISALRESGRMQQALLCVFVHVFLQMYHCTAHMPHGSLPLAHPSLAVWRVKWTTKVSALYLITLCAPVPGTPSFDSLSSVLYRIKHPLCGPQPRPASSCSPL